MSSLSSPMMKLVMWKLSTGEQLVFPYGLKALDDPTPVALDGLPSPHMGLTSAPILKFECPRIMSDGDFLYF